MLKHPLHPALVHFPVGAWGIASALDVLSFLGIVPADAWFVSSGLIGVGLATALVAMAAGAFDLFKLSQQQSHLVSRATRHAMVMAVVWCVYLAALVMRVNSGDLMPPSMLPLVTSLVAFAGLILGGWLGGDLVYRFGANILPLLKRDN